MGAARDGCRHEQAYQSLRHFITSDGRIYIDRTGEAVGFASSAAVRVARDCQTTVLAIEAAVRFLTLLSKELISAGLPRAYPNQGG
jgi:hypothetical protein